MKLILILLLFCTGAFATEPHFDLPKKDAKEQCAEVERVIRECGENTITDGKIHKCGNVYVMFPMAGMETEDGIVVLNSNHLYVGFLPLTREYPPIYIYVSNGEVTGIWNKADIPKNKKILTIKDCHIF